MAPANRHPETIAAIATPSGHGGIGIIKISGPLSKEIMVALFRPSRPRAQGVTHRLQHGVVVDPADGTAVDEVLVSWMAAPASYTGEDVVEINTHGGSIVMRRILDLVLGAGARMAQPGEFTRRGFLNGRIDLTQAEAVIDLVNAKTETAARMAGRHLSGELKHRTLAVKDALRALYATVAARIDFPDDVDDAVQWTGSAVSRLHQAVLAPLESLLAHHSAGQVVREGARVAVVGRPNVGKSSLMNRLLDRERVIVSQAPGTTRDAVTEITSIAGIPVTLVDTAGLRDTDDPVETIGIQKTREVLDTASIALYVVVAGTPLAHDDGILLDSLRDVPVIMVRNKMDLVTHHLEPPDNAHPTVTAAVTISAKFGQGIQRLKALIASVLTQGCDLADVNSIMPNARQAHHLSEARDALVRAVDILERQGEDELVAIEMDIALKQVNMVLGQHAPEDILDAVFSQFCIGK